MLQGGGSIAPSKYTQIFLFLYRPSPPAIRWQFNSLPPCLPNDPTTQGDGGGDVPGLLAERLSLERPHQHLHAVCPSTWPAGCRAALLPHAIPDGRHDPRRRGAGACVRSILRSFVPSFVRSFVAARLAHSLTRLAYLPRQGLLLLCGSPFPPYFLPYELSITAADY